MFKDRVLSLCFIVALGAGGAVSVAGAAWMRSLPPIQTVAGAMDTPAEAVQPIPQGRQDLRDFFASLGFTGEFKLVKAQRDEALGRRYYQATLSATDVPLFRDRLLRGWTNGRYNRAVYENGPTGGLPRSRNIPKWWSTKRAPDADQIMLAHGGNPNWYVVLEDGGAVCLMWVGR